VEVAVPLKEKANLIGSMIAIGAFFYSHYLTEVTVDIQPGSLGFIVIDWDSIIMFKYKSRTNNIVAMMLSIVLFLLCISVAFSGAQVVAPSIQITMGIQ